MMGWNSLGLVVLIVALVLAGAVPLPAQGILNTERFQTTDVSGGHLSVDISVSGALGNTSLLNASAAGIAGYRTDRHWTRFIGGGRFLADRERRLLNDHFVQLRYSFIISGKAQTFHFLQYQSNRSLLLRVRWLAGSGARRTVMQNDATALHLGTGLMYEEEHRDEARLAPTDTAVLRTVRLANQAVLSHELAGGAKILNVTYVQPALTSLGDLRLLNDLGVSVPIAGRASLGVSLEWRHDSQPPGDLGRNDISFRSGISIDLD